jgi:hypothetical protein
MASPVVHGKPSRCMSSVQQLAALNTSPATREETGMEADRGMSHPEGGHGGALGSGCAQVSRGRAVAYGRYASAAVSDVHSMTAQAPLLKSLHGTAANLNEVILLRPVSASLCSASHPILHCHPLGSETTSLDGGKGADLWRRGRRAGRSIAIAVVVQDLARSALVGRGHRQLAGMPAALTHLPRRARTPAHQPRRQARPSSHTRHAALL